MNRGHRQRANTLAYMHAYFGKYGQYPPLQTLINRLGYIGQASLRTMLKSLEDYVPKLVLHCRAFRHRLRAFPADVSYAWAITGIRDAIHRPEDRT